MNAAQEDGNQSVQYGSSPGYCLMCLSRLLILLSSCFTVTLSISFFVYLSTVKFFTAGWIATKLGTLVLLDLCECQKFFVYNPFATPIFQHPLVDPLVKLLTGRWMD